jgi:hypothetical protein
VYINISISYFLDINQQVFMPEQSKATAFAIAINARKTLETQSATQPPHLLRCLTRLTEENDLSIY